MAGGKRHQRRRALRHHRRIGDHVPRPSTSRSSGFAWIRSRDGYRSLAGAGSNNTAEAVELTRFAKGFGADGALLITPYYNKPTQEGLYQHFKRIASEVSMPFILYNVPGRTSVNLLPATVARLNKDIADVIGIKEATGDLNQVSQVLEFCGPDFQGSVRRRLHGPAPLVRGRLRRHLRGLEHLLPDKMSGMCQAWFAGDLPTAQKLHFELAPFSRMMFLTNPIPAKTSLSMMGRIQARTAPAPGAHGPGQHREPAHLPGLQGPDLIPQPANAKGRFPGGEGGLFSLDDE